jgi:fructose 1,6-bisphosphatase
MGAGVLECPHCRYMHGADDPPVRKKYATPKVVSETAMTRDLGDVMSVSQLTRAAAEKLCHAARHPTVIDGVCQWCARRVGGPIAPVEPESPAPTRVQGIKQIVTMGIGIEPRPTITVTQAELARLLFDGSTTVRKRAWKHAEIDGDFDSHPLGDAEIVRLQKVLDVMWNGTELERREMAKSRAAGAFRAARTRKP